jgi:fructose-1,6-bisphosphatase/inositol monophosphatase family enzyme
MPKISMDTPTVKTTTPGLSLEQKKSLEALDKVLIPLLFNISDEVRNADLSKIDVKEKASTIGQDFVTEIDTSVQKRIVESIPYNFGLIGEEDNLQRESKNGLTVSIDPLDGTKQFLRGIEAGVGTMISVFNNDKFHSAYIFDVYKRELITLNHEGYVIRLGGIDQKTKNIISGEFNPKTKNSCLLMDIDEEDLKYSIRTFGNNSKIQVTSGSVGIWAKKLFDGEVGRLMISKSGSIDFYTPWDFNPIFALAIALGFKAFLVKEGETEMEEIEMKPMFERQSFGGRLIIKQSDN